MSRVAVKLLCTKEREMVLNKLTHSRTEQIRLRAIKCIAVRLAHARSQGCPAPQYYYQLVQLNISECRSAWMFAVADLCDS